MELKDFEFNHLDPYINRVNKGQTAVVAVAGGADDAVLKTIGVAAGEGFVRALLFGPESDIRENLESESLPEDLYEVRDTADAKTAAYEAAAVCGTGEADILMKGFVDTGSFMRAVLNEESGLRTGKILSHVGFFDLPLYPRLIGMSDGGINVDPDFETRVEIVRNAVELSRTILQRTPRVALVAAVEKVQENMPVTLQWAAISKMAERGKFGDAVVDGPLGLDNALEPDAAEQKGINSPVQGQADIFVVPDIQSGNLVGKTMTYLADAPMAGLVVGAKAPVVLNSRVDSIKARLASLLMALAATH